MLYVRLITIKVKVGIPESFKVGWYPRKKTGSSHLKGGHLGFKCTEGAGVGACSGKGWGGGGAFQLLLKDHTENTEN